MVQPQGGTGCSCSFVSLALTDLSCWCVIGYLCFVWSLILPCCFCVMYLCFAEDMCCTSFCVCEYCCVFPQRWLYSYKAHFVRTLWTYFGIFCLLEFLTIVALLIAETETLRKWAHLIPSLSLFLLLQKGGWYHLHLHSRTHTFSPIVCIWAPSCSLVAGKLAITPEFWGYFIIFSGMHALLSRVWPPGSSPATHNSNHHAVLIL
mgnify:CR=1 FL=1